MNEKDFANYVKDRYKQDPNDNLGKEAKEFIKSEKFNVRVVENEEKLSWGESYIGTNFGSTQDYGKTWDKIKDSENSYSKEDLIEEVKDRVVKWSARQINFYDKDEDLVYTGLVVHLKKNGYSIYPDKESVYRF